MKVKVKLKLTESILGSSPANKELHSEYIASKAPDAASREEEIEAVGAAEVEHKEMTVFPRMKDGTPALFDYQVKGFFKNSAKALKKVPGTESAKKEMKNYKQIIDGLVFIDERLIPFIDYGEMGSLQRPLRASTPMGERVALANSEEIQAGASLVFTINMLKDDLWPAVREWLDYGALNGIGQWHNGGHGRFTWEEIR